MQRYSLKKLAAAIVLLSEKQPVLAVAQAAAAELTRQHRQRELPWLLTAVAEEWFRQRGELTATITTARPISVGVRKKINELLQRLTQAKRMQAVTLVDPLLVAGWRAETPVVTVDATLQTKLKTLTRHG